MNQANLAKLFHNYIESYNVLTDAEHDELYKWRAVNHFQKHWNLEADEFGEMFKQAMEQSFNIVNNSIVQPANGIVFLCKQDKKTEEEVAAIRGVGKVSMEILKENGVVFKKKRKKK